MSTDCSQKEVKGENVFLSEHALFAGNTGARTFACNEMTGLITLPQSSASFIQNIQNNECYKLKKKDKVNNTKVKRRCEKEQERMNQSKSEEKIDNNEKEMVEREKERERDDEKEEQEEGGEEEEQEEGGGEEFITVDELRQMTPWSYQVGRSLDQSVGHLAIMLQDYF